jgi:hypothetical protein
MPRSIVDPRGNDGTNSDEPPSQFGGDPNEDHRWVYGYDVHGNVTKVTDPRGSVAGGPSSQPTKFSTVLGYDNLDRLKTEHVPKCSDTSTASCASSGGDADSRFIDRAYVYDDNGNRTSAHVLGTGATRDYVYSPTDKLEEDEDGPTLNQVTTRRYDSEDRLEEVELPEGNTMRYLLDGAGRVERRRTGRG